MNVIDCEQGTDEWHAARCGRVTASKVTDIIATTRSGPAASRANYMAELVAQRLTGRIPEGFTNAAMKHGTETEPLARQAYSFRIDADVAQVGFVVHPEIEQAGASPDGLVVLDGLVEIKCPNTATHIETLLGAKIPDKYIVQMQWQMACTERQWCDFVSFDNRMPPHMAISVQRVDRDDKRIAELEKSVKEFLQELDGRVAALRKRYEQKEAA